MPKDRLRIGMLISGGGTTVEQIFIACMKGDLRGLAEPAVVISSRRGAAGIRRMLDAGMDPRHVIVIRPRDFETPEEYGEAINRACDERGVDFLGQYGHLAKTPENVINHFPGMMVNQHPGPLDPRFPDFGGDGMYGLRVHCARIYYARATGLDFWTEATAQRVAPEYDEGAVITRWSLPIQRFPRDTARTLAAKLLPLEHALHIHIIGMFARGEDVICKKSERCLRFSYKIEPKSSENYKQRW